MGDGLVGDGLVGGGLVGEGLVGDAATDSSDGAYECAQVYRFDHRSATHCCATVRRHSNPRMVTVRAYSQLQSADNP